MSLINSPYIPPVPEMPADQRDGEWWKTVLAAAGALVVVAIVVVIAGLAVRTFGGSTSDRGPIVPAADAPPSDLYVRVLPGRDSQATAAELLSQHRNGSGEMTVIAGTVEHVAVARSALADTHIFRWEAEFDLGDGPTPSFCEGHFFDAGSAGADGYACSAMIEDRSSPSYSHGASSGGELGELNTVTTMNAPVEAEWMVVTSPDGIRIVARVVDQASHVVWQPATLGPPRSVEFLDVRHHVLWSG